MAKNTMFAGIFIVCMILFAAVPAYCYIDLGTGSYLLQIAIASLVGALFTLKIYWKKAIGLFKKFLSRSK